VTPPHDHNVPPIPQVQQTRQHTQKAKKILTGMGRRAMTNKIVLWFIILLLLGAIVLVIYFDFVKPNATPATTAAPG
jgi:hypothetical protein